MKLPALPPLCWLFALLLAACGGGGGSGTPVAKVSVTPSTASVMAGEQIQLTAAITDDNGALLIGHPVTWISGNAGHAMVSATGRVTAILARTGDHHRVA